MSKFFSEADEDQISQNVITAMRVWRMQCESCDYFEYSWQDPDGDVLVCPECKTVSQVRS